MLYFYRIDSHLKNEEIISLLKEYKGIVLSPDLAVFKEYIEFCHGRTVADFKAKTNIANEFAIQWLCKISCQTNIKNSIDFCKPDGEIIAIVSERKIPVNAIKKIGDELKTLFPSEKLAQKIADKYGIPKIALEKYGLEKLLEEKTLAAFLD